MSFVLSVPFKFELSGKNLYYTYNSLLCTRMLKNVVSDRELCCDVIPILFKNIHVSNIFAIGLAFHILPIALHQLIQRKHRRFDCKLRVSKENVVANNKIELFLSIDRFKRKKTV